MGIYNKHIFICTNQRPLGTRPSCGEEQGLKLVQQFKKQLLDNNLNAEVRAQKCGCLDICEKGPMIVIYPEGVFYGGVTVDDVQEIVETHIGQGIPVTRLLVTEK